jgi:hypothetical protein
VRRAHQNDRLNFKELTPPESEKPVASESTTIRSGDHSLGPGASLDLARTFPQTGDSGRRLGAAHRAAAAAIVSGSRQLCLPRPESGCIARLSSSRRDAGALQGGAALACHSLWVPQRRATLSGSPARAISIPARGLGLVETIPGRVRGPSSGCERASGRYPGERQGDDRQTSITRDRTSRDGLLLAGMGAAVSDAPAPIGGRLRPRKADRLLRPCAASCALLLLRKHASGVSAQIVEKLIVISLLNLCLRGRADLRMSHLRSPPWDAVDIT